MSNNQSNAVASMGKRKFLAGVAGVYAGIGAIFGIVPFVKSFQPSRRAKAVGAPVDVDISVMKPGELKIVKWRGRPVWILRRTDQMNQSLSLVTDLLADPESNKSKQPEYTKNTYRSLDDEWLVAEGICTHLGCSPVFRPDLAAEDLGSDWQGGFFCPCHGSKFDLAGRVYKNVPAPTNLTVPPYTFVNSTTIRVGADNGVS